VEPAAVSYELPTAAKKVRLEMTPQQEFHDILQTQFQAISEAFHVISVTMGKVLEE